MIDLPLAEKIDPIKDSMPQGVGENLDFGIVFRFFGLLLSNMILILGTGVSKIAPVMVKMMGDIFKGGKGFK